MKNEIWRAIKGWEKLYQVSSFGRVRSLGRVIKIKDPKGRLRKRHYRPRILKAAGIGYDLVSFTYPKRKRACFYVHSLVALAFIGPRPKGFEICHNDGNPRNNHVSNLRYGTPKENAADTELHGRRHRPNPFNSPWAKLTREDVKQIKKLSPRFTQRELGKIFGVSHSRIGAVQRGEAYAKD